MEFVVLIVVGLGWMCWSAVSDANRRRRLEQERMEQVGGNSHGTARRAQRQELIDAGLVEDQASPQHRSKRP